MAGETSDICSDLRLLRSQHRRNDETWISFEGYHPRATTELARHLANRLSGLDIRAGDNWIDPEAQRSLFNGKC